MPAVKECFWWKAERDLSERFASNGCCERALNCPPPPVEKISDELSIVFESV
jgi:hypothetical protein